MTRKLLYVSALITTAVVALVPSAVMAASNQKNFNPSRWSRQHIYPTSLVTSTTLQST